MVEMPYISPKFTIDDIHRIREYNYEVTKDMTVEEQCKYYNDAGRAFLKELEELKQKENIE